MPEQETSKAVQFLDLLLRFFAPGEHWVQDQYQDDGGRRCLVGAVLHLSSKHRLPDRPVMSLLEAALPQPQLSLILFNDNTQVPRGLDRCQWSPGNERVPRCRSGA